MQKNLYSRWFVFFLFLNLLYLTSPLLAGESSVYDGSSFSEVWQALQKTADEEDLPASRVSRPLDLIGGAIWSAAKRTLNYKFDLFSDTTNFPARRKLVHPFGICFAGNWTIDKASKYTGLFSEGVSTTIIIRASEALGYVKKKHKRAFGFAGKIFPNTDYDSENIDLTSEKVQTADFFTVDDLGGTAIEQFFSSTFINEPPISISLRLAPNVLAVGVLTAQAFSSADSHAGIRPLYPLSESGLEDKDEAVTPSHMRIIGGDFERISEYQDFREESRLENYKKKIVLTIEVREKPKAKWQKIGEISLFRDVISKACDQNLHFHHPKWK